MATPAPDMKKLIPANDSREKIEFFYESRFYEMGKRIAAMDSLKTDLFCLQKDVKSLSEILLEASEDLKVQKELSQKEFSALHKSIDYVDGKFAEVFQKIESETNAIKKTLADHEDFKRYHYSLEKRVLELEKKISTHLCVQEEFNSQYKNLAERQDRFDKASLRFVEDISKIRSDIVSQFDKINCLKDFDQSLQKAIDSLSQSADKQSKESLTRSESVRQTLGQKITDLAKQLEDKISSIVVPSVSSFCTKEELNKATMDIRIFSLDAKNAFSNTVNLESQVNYLGKKIDSVLVQMKSYELDRMK